MARSLRLGPADSPLRKVLWVDLPDPSVESGWTNVAASCSPPCGRVGVMFSRPTRRSDDPSRRQRSSTPHRDRGAGFRARPPVGAQLRRGPDSLASSGLGVEVEDALEISEQTEV